jgi:hypothetical protein
MMGGIPGTVATNFNDVMGMFGLNHGVVGKDAIAPTPGTPAFDATVAAGRTASQRDTRESMTSAHSGRGQIGTGRNAPSGGGHMSDADATTNAEAAGVAAGQMDAQAQENNAQGYGPGHFGGGGSSSSSSGGTATGNAMGGPDGVGRGNDRGGGIGFLEGGLVTDKNPDTLHTEQKFANISEGEFVLSRAAVQYYGLKKLEDMNQKAIEHFGTPDPKPQTSPEKIQENSTKSVDKSKKPNTPNTDKKKKTGNNSGDPLKRPQKKGK